MKALFELTLIGTEKFRPVKSVNISQDLPNMYESSPPASSYSDRESSTDQAENRAGES